MWQYARRIMIAWTRETAMDQPLRVKHPETESDQREQPHEGLYEPSFPKRPPTPEDFIRDLRESDPLRRFRF
jgi:hypothetical protein